MSLLTSRSRPYPFFVAAAAGMALAACSGSSSDLDSDGPVTPPPPPPPSSLCPTGTTPVSVGSEQHCRLTGTVTGNVTLTNNFTYQLSGRVVVGVDTGAEGNASGGNASSLTIQPGTRVYAQDLNAYLVIARGSRLNADGTSSSPIIFTSAQDLGFGPAGSRAPHTGSASSDPNTREWGGIVINGRAPINTGPSTACGGGTISQAEGEGNSGCYGGNLATDNSGVLRYVQVRYAGNPVTATNELNTIAFQGVGSGTTVDYVQAHNGADDGIEMFGGSVNMKHVVVTGADDDSLDWTFGWNGKVQYALVIQNPNLAGTDTGIEADNNEFNNDATPRANPTISNMTLLGARTVGTRAVLLRRGTAANLLNFVINDGWPSAGLDIDGTPTYAQASAGNLTLRSFYISAAKALETDADDATLPAFYATPAWNNATGPSTLVSFIAGRPAFINGPNENARPAVNASTIDPFFDAVTYIGAVRDAGSNWTQGWTFGLN